MPNIETDEQQELHDILMKVWNREWSADDAFEELDAGPVDQRIASLNRQMGIVLNQRDAALERERRLREACDKLLEGGYLLTNAVWRDVLNMGVPDAGSRLDSGLRHMQRAMYEYEALANTPEDNHDR